MLTFFALFAQASDLTLLVHDPTTQAGPADRCEAAHCRALLGVLDGATHTIDFAFYGFRHQTVLLDAMVRAEARGVTIRGVVDADIDGNNVYASTAAWRARFPTIRDDRAVDARSKATERTYFGTPRCGRPPGTAGPVQCTAFDLGDRCLLSVHASVEPIVFDGDIQHHKFVVVDGQRVWTGSSNASDSGTGGYNANLVWLIDSPVVAAWFTREFETMYVDGKFHREKPTTSPMQTTLSDGTAIEAWFSPQQQPVTRAVIPLVARSRSTIDVGVFYLTHNALTQALIDAHRRGVRVRVLLDATAATNAYSKHEILRRAGIEVRVEDFGGKMHAKSMVIDGALVLAGSMNYTRAGDDKNDENTLIVRSPPLAAQATAWFEALWGRIDPRWASSGPDPESRDSGSACTDGMDNDYDGLVDQRDPGCGPLPPPMASGGTTVTVVPKRGTCAWPAPSTTSPKAPSPAAR